MKEKSITIYDIAREANVSSATVSRVLAGNYPVSEDTKKKVLSIVEKYKFQPNAVARSLSKKETKTIGFVLPDITNPFFSQVFIEVEKYALSKGYTIFLCNSMNDTEIESQYLRLLAERQVEGIILMGGRINKAKPEEHEVTELEEIMQKVPVLMINGKIDQLNCYSVRTKEDKGIELIIDYLVENGHEKIALIGGIKEVTTTDVKVTAFRNALKKYQLPIMANCQIYSGFDINSGENAMGNLLENNMGNLPTAVIGINDMVVIGAIKECEKRNLDLKKFSFVGFDNTNLAEISTPQLTSISHNYRELGQQAVEILINPGNQRKDVEIEPSLYIRDSSKKNY